MHPMPASAMPTGPRPGEPAWRPTGTADQPTAAQKTAALRRQLIRQLVFELVLPLGGFYALRGTGLSQWLSLVGAAVLALPGIAYTVIRQRKVDMMVFFALSIVLGGALLSLVTGSPRVLLIRDAWIFGVLGVWALATLLTRKPFMLVMARAVVIAKIGAEGARQWEARWDVEPRFRHHVRVVTAVWGLGFLLDAVVRVIFAATLPIDVVPLASTVQWLVVLGLLLTFHIRYITKHNLKV